MKEYFYTKVFGYSDDVLYIDSDDVNEEIDCYEEDVKVYFTDGTDSAYFKRVYTSYWVDDDPFLICTRCEAEINKNNSVGAKNHTNYCPCCGSCMVGCLENDSE